MAKYFLESSALTKRYKQESGSNFVNSLFSGAHELFYLNLAIVEIRKVFYRLWKYPQTLQNDTQITEQEFRELESRFAADIIQMQRIEFTEEMVGRVAIILEQRWLRLVFDLAQLTAYLVTKDEYPDLIFVCSDKAHLSEVAKDLVGEEYVMVPENVSAT